MVSEISVLYANTSLILGTAAITPTIGLRQGSPTSCFFIYSILKFICETYQTSMRRRRFPKLGTLSDDTVLLATSRERALEKLVVFQNWCNSSGMIMNMKKPKFMAVNGVGWINGT